MQYSLCKYNAIHCPLGIPIAICNIRCYVKSQKENDEAQNRLNVINVFNIVLVKFSSTSREFFLVNIINDRSISDTNEEKVKLFVAKYRKNRSTIAKQICFRDKISSGAKSIWF